jgi:hypothetical protein
MRLPRLSCPVRRVAPVLAASLLACAAVSVSRPASAQRVYVYAEPPPPPPPGPRYYYYDDYRERPYAFVLAVDLEGAIPVNPPQFLDGYTLSGGGGFKLRAGEQIRLQGGMRITPELGYGYEHLFASDDNGDQVDWELSRVFAGARLSFGRFVVPVVYAHIGYGWQDTGDPNSQAAGGISYDVGGAIDLRVIPHFDFGAHIEYAAIEAQPYSFQWLALGVHGAVIF